MKSKSKINKTDSTAKIINDNSVQAEESTAKVLYQKMGDRWFAFSVIDDEVFVGSISNDDLKQFDDPSVPRKG